MNGISGKKTILIGKDTTHQKIPQAWEKWVSGETRCLKHTRVGIRSSRIFEKSAGIRGRMNKLSR